MHDLALLSPADVLHAWRWKQKHDERLERTTWEQTRLLAAYLAAPYSKEKIKDLTKFMPFEWDNKKEGKLKVGSPEWLAHRREVIARIKAKQEQKANG